MGEQDYAISRLSWLVGSGGQARSTTSVGNSKTRQDKASTPSVHSLRHRPARSRVRHRTAGLIRGGIGGGSAVIRKRLGPAVLQQQRTPHMRAHCAEHAQICEDVPVSGEPRPLTSLGVLRGLDVGAVAWDDGDEALAGEHGDGAVGGAGRHPVGGGQFDRGGQWCVVTETAVSDGLA
jgi:hypothetical protein